MSNKVSNLNFNYFCRWKRK